MQEKHNSANGTYENVQTANGFEAMEDLHCLHVISPLKAMAEYCVSGNTFSVDKYVLCIFHSL